MQTSLGYLFSCSLLRVAIHDLHKGHGILLPVIILSQHYLTLYAFVCFLNGSNLPLQCKLHGQRLWWFCALLCHHDLEECIVRSSWLIDSCWMKEFINIWLLGELAGRHRMEKADMCEIMKKPAWLEWKADPEVGLGWVWTSYQDCWNPGRELHTLSMDRWEPG